MASERSAPTDAADSAPTSTPRAPGTVCAVSEASPSATEAEAEKPPSWAPLTLAAFVALVIATNIAAAVWARWIEVNPEGLLVLSSRNRYLALTLAAGVPLSAYVVIGTIRIATAFVVCHMIGRAYGATALGWFTKYLGISTDAIDGFNRGFVKAEWALIPVFAGSNIVAAMTGVRRTPPVRLAVLLAIGIAGRLILMWWLARTFETQLVAFLEWVAGYQWWIVGISVGLVVLFNMRNLRRG